MGETLKIQASYGSRPIDRPATRPLYLQVYEVIMGYIAFGKWQPNQVIPNEYELARKFAVSPGTMRKALELAETDGLLSRRQGHGTFVCDRSSYDYVKRYYNIRNKEGERLIGDVQIIEIVERSADEEERARLCLRHRDLVYRIRRARSVQGKIYELEDLIMPVKMFCRLAMREDASLHLVELAQKCGVLLGESEERVMIGHVRPDDAIDLDVEAGTTVLQLDRVTRTLQGSPAAWCLMQCLLDEDRYYLAQVR